MQIRSLYLEPLLQAWIDAGRFSSLRNTVRKAWSYDIPFAQGAVSSSSIFFRSQSRIAS